METRIIAVDPGNEQSALIVYDKVSKSVRAGFLVSNEELIQWLVGNRYRGALSDIPMYCEMPFPRGQYASWQLFSTCVMVGRLKQIWPSFYLVNRMNVKMAVCGSAAVKDAQVRAALIERWGGKERAIGKKNSPGPFFSIKADMWQALAIAVMVADRQYKPYESYIEESMERSQERRAKKKAKKLAEAQGKIPGK